MPARKKKKNDLLVSQLAVDDIECGVDTTGKTYNHITELWKEEIKEQAKQDDNLSVTSTSSFTSTSSISSNVAESRVKRKNTAVSSSSCSSSSSSSSAVSEDSSDVELKKRKNWYEKGAQYWSTQEATVNGVLGGFGHLSPIGLILLQQQEQHYSKIIHHYPASFNSPFFHFIVLCYSDVGDSRVFLQSLPNVQFGTAIDCGAGIGRVAKDLLCQLFSSVDLVEQNPSYVNSAESSITHPHMKHFYTAGLQEFSFTPNYYDVIWIQWVISHLTDDDLIDFLSRCVLGLKEGGYICLKENTAKKGFVMDCDDSSVTRSDALFKELFQKAGFTIVRQATQTKFPKALFTVRMYALQKNKQLLE